MKPSSFREPAAPERRRTVVVAYDVVDDRRRSRVADALLDHGVRVQYSVFECVLTAGERRLLARRLQSLIEPAEDAVSLYVLCRRCRPHVKRLGREPPPSDPQYVIL
jgi:CRISPR-associated protein Cas2